MNSFNYQIYNKDAEAFGGDYWIFLDLTSDEIKNNNIYLGNIKIIIKNIINEDLKIKMKKKLFNLIMENGIFFYGIEQNLDIFNINELKIFFEREFNTKILPFISNQENTNYYFSDIMSFINLLKKVNDINWEYTQLTIILNQIKTFTDKTFLVRIIESYNFSEIIYNKLINKYYKDLPIEYQNFLKMKQDKNYIYNNSLNFMKENINIDIDPKISIGPEIEANNDYYLKIELGNQNGFEDYEIHSEATVYNGNEIATRKPFHNIKEEVAKFCGLCKTMKDIGYYYNETIGNAAGQINLGLDYLDTKEAILIFYEIYGNCEELLYYISNEDGQLFRQDVYTNSRIKAISEIIGKRILDEELSREQIIKLFNSNLYGEDKSIKGLQYKKNSVCLRGSCEKDYRLEFRIPNGGCNYRTWIDNIRLYGKIMEIAKNIADIMKKDYLTEEEQKLLENKINLQNNNLTIEEKLVILMDLLFKEDNLKEIYYKRYISTIKRTKETNSTKYINNNIYEPNFDEVEFIGQYQSRLGIDYIGDDVIEYDPEEGFIKHSQKK